MAKKRTNKVSWDQVEAAADAIAVKVLNDFEHTYTGIYAIPRGGLVLGVMLSHRLKIPLVNRINSKTLVVDDVADTGQTLNKYLRSQVAVVVWKKGSKFEPAYFGQFTRTKNWIQFPWEI